MGGRKAEKARAGERNLWTPCLFNSCLEIFCAIKAQFTSAKQGIHVSMKSTPRIFQSSKKVLSFVQILDATTVFIQNTVLGIVNQQTMRELWG